MYIKQDAWSKFFTTPLYDFNPESLVFLKQSGDAGYLVERDRLFAAMYGEWDVLLKDVDKMCNAVSTLNYTVVPKVDESDPTFPAAQKVADIVSKALWMRSPHSELGSWRHTFLQMVGTIYHAICRSVNVHEILWERSAGLVYPRSYVPVQANYYGWAIQPNEPDRLVLYRDGNPYGKGEPFPRGKFIVALNPNGPDHPIRAARFISLVGWFGAAKWGLPWLMKYCQVFGLPWRKFTVGSEEDKAAKLAELASQPIISDTVVFGEENVEIMNAAASGASIPQEELLRLAENACHKLILGQTLTSDTSDNGGSLAQAKVHAGVLADEVLYVGNYVCETLNQQLIPEIVRANFGSVPGDMIPELRCAVPQAQANLDQLQIYKGLQEMGVKLTEADVCDKFGVPMAGPDDKVLQPAAQQAASQGGPGDLPPPGGDKSTSGLQEPSLVDELNDEPIDAAASDTAVDIDALTKAAEAAAEDAHRKWTEPFFDALASALDQGMTPSEILSALEGWRPDTEALADALATTARASLGRGGDAIEAYNAGGCNQYGHGWVDNICPWGGGSGSGSPMGTAGSPGGMFTSGPNAGNVSKGIDPDEEKRKKEEAAKAEAEAKQKEAEAKAEAERKAAEEAKAKEEAAKREAEEKAKREAEERRAAEEKARKEKEQKSAEDDSGLDKNATAKKIEKAVANRAKNPKDTSLIPMPVDKAPKMNAPVELGNYAKMPTNGDDKSAENLAIREAHALNLTNHQMQNWNSLSVKQRALLLDYTDDRFEDINRSLYDSNGLISDRGLDYYKDTQAEAVGLHQAINKFSTPYNMVVTRGTYNEELVNMGLGELMPSWGKIDTTAVKAMQKKLTKGEKIEYTNPAFSSTSLDSSNTQYRRPVIIKTFVPKGTHAVYAEPFSVYGKLKNGLNALTPNAMLGVSPRSENELLLNSRTKHRVLSVKVVDNTLEIYTIVEQS